MAPAVELESRIGQNIIKQEDDVDWMSKNEHNIDAEISNSVISVIAKGQSMLTKALQTLRWSETKTFSVNCDEIIPNQENCRPIITLKEVATHDTYDDCWIILYDRVYDVTQFLNEHPAGRDVILEHAGRDASTAFRGHSKLAIRSLKFFEIGELPIKEQIYRKPGLLKCQDMPE